MIAYLLSQFPHRFSPKRRRWIDETPGKFAAYCLPMMIANELGHQLLCTAPVRATWDGTQGPGGLVVEGPATSIFGSGIVTFHAPAIFRTGEGIHLLVTGPTNQPKHGVSPLTGVIEAEWIVATWTMNWMLTEPGTVEWEEGEPYAQIMEFDVRLAAGQMSEQPMPQDVREQYQAWSEKRARWNGAQRDLDYLKGTSPGGASAPPGGHMKTLRRRAKAL